MIGNVWKGFVVLFVVDEINRDVNMIKMISMVDMVKIGFVVWYVSVGVFYWNVVVDDYGYVGYINVMS